LVDASALAPAANEFNSGHFDVSDSGFLRLEDLMLLSGKQLGEGGAIRNRGGEIVVERSVLYGNNASFRGGAIASSDGQVRIRESLIARNGASTATAAGGGIFISSSTDFGSLSLLVENSTIWSNSASRTDPQPTSEASGGGVYIGSDSRAKFVQVTIANNRATARGGGISVSSAALVEIDQSTIVENRADTNANDPQSENGGGLHNPLGPASTVQIRNTLIAANENSELTNDPQAPDCAGAMTIHFSLISDTRGCIITGDNNQTDVDAQLLAYGDRGGRVPTIGFQTTSPARDSADSLACPLTDARGQPRAVGAGCDIGAWESGNPFSFIPKLSADGPDIQPANEVCSAALSEFPGLPVCTLRAAINEAVGLANPFPVEALIELEAFDYSIGAMSLGDDSEDAGQIGDLDVFGQARIVIEGAGARTTRILSTGTDRLFNLLGPAGPELTLRDLSLEGGAAPPSASGGNLLVTGTGTATLERTQVTGGSGNNGGGLAAFSSGELVVRQSTISFNAATSRGGGIYANGAQLDLVNSTIHGNDADLDGGGVAVNAGGYELDLVTVTNNDADADRNDSGVGGGLYVAEAETGTVRGTVLAFNRDGSPNGEQSECAGVVDSSGFNLVRVHTSCGFSATGDLTGSTTIPLSPALSPLQDNGGPTDTREPLAGSNLIDVGPSANLPPTDQRGFSRIVDGDGIAGARADIGAVESVGDAIFNDRFDSGNITVRD